MIKLQGFTNSLERPEVFGVRKTPEQAGRSPVQLPARAEQTQTDLGCSFQLSCSEIKPIWHSLGSVWRFQKQSEGDWGNRQPYQSKTKTF